jgi:hypothetical protein
MQTSLYDPGPLQTPNLWNKTSLDKTSLKAEPIEFADDIFKFGLVMLVSAIGSFDLLDLHQTLIENAKKVIDEEARSVSGTPSNSKICCLIHSEDYLYSLSSPTVEKGGSAPPPPLLTIKTLLLD